MPCSLFPSQVCGTECAGLALTPLAEPWCCPSPAILAETVTCSGSFCHLDTSGAGMGGGLVGFFFPTRLLGPSLSLHQRSP